MAYSKTETVALCRADREAHPQHGSRTSTLSTGTPLFTTTWDSLETCMDEEPGSRANTRVDRPGPSRRTICSTLPEARDASTAETDAHPLIGANTNTRSIAPEVPSTACLSPSSSWHRDPSRPTTRLDKGGPSRSTISGPPLGSAAGRLRGAGRELTLSSAAARAARNSAASVTARSQHATWATVLASATKRLAKACCSKAACWDCTCRSSDWAALRAA
mmetsp:Transcript_17215/g.43789  ORF Transcript_17215/g.43789 Transcript_17215/m.43789 type:complete len:219 (+) Transcript_17215:156-812(+)